jgi:hypothetical protein
MVSRKVRIRTISVWMVRESLSEEMAFEGSQREL